MVWSEAARMGKNSFTGENTLFRVTDSAHSPYPDIIPFILHNPPWSKLNNIASSWLLCEVQKTFSTNSTLAWAYTSTSSVATDPFAHFFYSPSLQKTRSQSAADDDLPICQDVACCSFSSFLAYEHPCSWYLYWMYQWYPNRGVSAPIYKGEVYLQRRPSCPYTMGGCQIILLSWRDRCWVSDASRGMSQRRIPTRSIYPDPTTAQWRVYKITASGRLYWPGQ